MSVLFAVMVAASAATQHQSGGPRSAWCSERDLIAGALAATSACNDHRAPTAPITAHEALAAAAGGGNSQKVKVKTLQLSSNTLRIGGPGANAMVSIGNPGLAIQTGISIRAEIVQGAATRQAANILTQCQPGDDPGFLPNGNCEMTVVAAASNASAGSGTLAPGAAVFVLRILQTVGGAETELATRSVDVNLVGTPSITTLTLTSTTLAIDGPSANYTATMQNPSNSLQGVVLQGYVVQGSTRRAAGGVSVICGGSIGLLTPGTCTISFSLSASNSASGIGTLTPGSAVFELGLIQNGSGTSTTFDTRTISVTLVSSTPRITSLVLVSTSIVIGGPSVGYTVQVQNPGFPVSGMLMQGEIAQDTDAGTVTKAAGGFTINCGAGVGVLPTTGTGTCSMQFTASASNSAAGLGTLVPGLARFVLRLRKPPVSGQSNEVDSRTVDVTLVAQIPTITAITPTSSFIVLGASFTSYTATIQNPGPSRSIVLIQGWISQGSARRAAGGTQLLCSGAAPGELPTGSCDAPGDMVAGNDPADGTGTLVPGPATFELELKQFNGTSETILDTRTIPITLVAATPSIVSVVLNSTSVPIGGSTPYTATLYNPTGATLSVVLIQGELSQGATLRAAGGTILTCVTSGELPPGSCVVSFVVVASNTGDGSGTLVPGSATFVLKLIHEGTLLDTKTMPVTLTIP